MKKKIELFLLSIAYGTQILSLAVFVYIVVAHILNLLATDQFVDPRVFELDYLRILIAIALSTSCACLIILLVMKKTQYVNFFILPIKEKLSQVFITVVFAFFFTANTRMAAYKEVFILIPVLVVLLAALPSLIEMYSKLNILDYRRAVAALRAAGSKTQHKASLFVILTVAASLIFMINAALVIMITTDYIQGTNTREIELHRSVYIQKISPPRTTQAEHVIIFGFNLGWNRDGRSHVKSNGGEITTGIWNNNEVEFEIPLYIKPGKWQVWVELPKKEYDPKSEILVSNKVNLEITSRFDYYPQESDNILVRQWKKIKRFIFLK